jgi:AraC family transcriptional regulator
LGSAGRDGPIEVLREQLVLSSGQRGWRGVTVGLYRQSSGELDTPPFAAHAVIVHLSGPIRVRYRADGRSYEGVELEGDVSILPAGQPREWRWNAPSEDLRMVLEPGFLRWVAEEAGVPRAERLELVDNFRVRDQRLEHVARAFKAELEAGGLGGRLYAESLANVLAVHLIRHYSSLCPGSAHEDGGRSGLSRNALGRAVGYIEENLSEDLTLADIAEAARVSPYHFSRLFKVSAGLSPHQYVIHRRVESAKNLLSKTNLPIAEVAQRVGFADQAHLTNQFKRLVGVTPGAFR